VDGITREQAGGRTACAQRRGHLFWLAAWRRRALGAGVGRCAWRADAGAADAAFHIDATAKAALGGGHWRRGVCVAAARKDTYDGSAALGVLREVFCGRRRQLPLIRYAKGMGDWVATSAG